MDQVAFEQNEYYEALHEQIMAGSFDGATLNTIEAFSKADFLRFLAEKGTLLFHGTNTFGIQALEPRQANCRSKKFGNMCAVYATQDPVLPMFHAVFNNRYFSGVASSGVTEASEGETYNFNIRGTFADGHRWTDGCVYLLDKAQFEQGADDSGELINEFISRSPVTPLAKIQISPVEFPYLEDVVFE